VDDRTRAIRDELVAAQAALVEALERVGPDDWQRQSPNEGWTIQHLLTHLSTSETGFLTLMRRMASGDGGLPTDFDPNRWNAGQLRRNTETSVAGLRDKLDTAANDILALLDTLDDRALDQRGYLSTGVEGSTEDGLRLNASHKRTHTDDIRAALPVGTSTS
jgi:uncharacterized protein (TIGR03083 family)